MTKATSAPQLAPGTVIDGMYTLGESLRSRVGAVTYEATDPNDKKVEVTVYRADSFMNPMAVERALRELRQVSTVDDARVVHVFDSGKLKDGGVYEVHEHVEGKTLAEVGAVDAADASQILRDVVAALEAASKSGVIHRNLGPEVVIRSGDGVKVGGFAVGEPQGGVSFGAIECIAPEQVEGKSIDEPTLVYNLAALGHRLLTGNPIFVGDVATQLLQHAASTPPGEVNPALLAGLAKDAKSRPSLSDFAAGLGKLADGPRARPVSAATAAAFGGFGKVGAPSPRIGAPPATTPRIGAPPGSVAPPPTLGGRTLFGSPGGSGPKPAAPPLSSVGAPSLKPAAPPISPPGLPSLGGPPAATGGKPGAKPRTRGWTMFMEATDDESAPPVVAAPTAPAAPSAPSVPPVAAAPVVAPSLGAPSLAAPPTPSVPTLGAPVAAPSLGAPVAAPSLGAPSLGAPSLGAPSLGAPSLGAPSLGAPSLGAPSLGAPSLGAPSLGAPSLTAPPASAAAPVESKPSVRGWTLIMDDPEEAAAATPAVPAPAVTPGAPSTRGWTMLEELNESPEAAATGVPMPADDAAAAGAAPTSRGWTMFMEAELEGEKAAAEAAAAAAAASEAEPAESDFYDGPMTTDAGTVVAFAPEAPSARPPTPAAATPEPREEALSSFATKLRGDEEPIASFASKLRGDEPAEPEESLEDLAKQATGAARLSPPVDLPATTPEVPSFGGSPGFDLKPTAPIQPSPTSADRDPAPIDDEDDRPASSMKPIVIIVLMLGVVLAVVYFLFLAK